jgi:tyrosyl-DNA phosphodiesterase-1
MIIATYRDVPSPGKGKPLEDSETEDDSDDEIEVIQPAIGWAYIGSHNFTPSAWGTLSGSSFNPILNVSSHLIFDFRFYNNLTCLDLELRSRGCVSPER